MRSDGLAPTRLAGLLLTALTLACGASQSWSAVPRPVPGLPDRFVAELPDSARSEHTCAVHLHAPGDDTRLTLIRSIDGGSEALIGDYRVEPSGRFGLGPDELLRLNCVTGRPRGAVHR